MLAPRQHVLLYSFAQRTQGRRFASDRQDGKGRLLVSVFLNGSPDIAVQEWILYSKGNSSPPVRRAAAFRVFDTGYGGPGGT